MSTVKNEVKDIEQLAQEIDFANTSKCMFCGMCLAHCPTYREFLLEITSPRGRVALINSYLEGKLPLSEKFKKTMRLCLDCRACSTYCPSGVQPGPAVVSMRAHIESMGRKNLFKSLILEKLVPNPELLRLATFPLRLYQRLGIQKALRKLGILKPFPFAVADMEAMLPQYQGSPLSLRIEEVTPAKCERKMRAGFFLGCAMNLMLPRASEATIDVVTRLGCEVVTPKEVKCCGAPHINEGDAETARKLARYNIDLFLSKDVDVIFTDCAACGAELCNYVHLFKNNPEYEKKAEELAYKLRDVSQLILELGFNAEMCESLDDIVITYDEPCHLRHGQGVQHPNKILASLPGVKFKKLKDAEWCCGSAGTYWLTHKDTADKILQKKLDAIKEINPDYIITSNPGCLLQLNKAVWMGNLKGKVIHLTELLKMCLRL